MDFRFNDQPDHDTLAALTSREPFITLMKKRVGSTTSFLRLICGLTLALTWVLGLPWTASATNYYVDPATGKMSNPGTAASPWSTLQDVFRTHPNNKFVGGDVIFLRSGYHGKPTVSGNITSGTVTIQPDIGASPTLMELVVKPGARWIISGLDICPLYSGTFDKSCAKIVDLQAPNITFQNCAVRGAFDTSTWTLNDWKSNLVGYQEGICVAGSNSQILNNKVQNVCFGLVVGESASFSLVSGNAIDIFSKDAMNGFSSDTVYEYNIATNCVTSINDDGNHDDFFQCWTTGTDRVVGHGTISRVTLRGNIFISQTVPNLPLASSAMGISCFAGMYDGWVVENNLISTETWNGIVFIGAINCTVVNNTVVENYLQALNGVYKPKIDFRPHPKNKDGSPWSIPNSGNIVRNNITSGEGFGSPDGVVGDHNITVDSASYFVDYKNNNFSLKPTASAVNAGSKESAPSVDVLGNTRTAPYDMGAYEYIASTPTITSPLVATATNGIAFSYSIAATNSPTCYSCTGLSNGLKVDAAKGLISGTPTATGTLSVKISATNAKGSGSALLLLTVQNPVTSHK